jgi:hypothetical protein
MMRLIVRLVMCVGLFAALDAHAAGPVMSTAAAPSLTEGTANSFSGDLSGNTRVSIGTLLSGEDQTNNLLMTSGGAVRQTTVESQITDTTSAATTVPVGSKTFMGVLTGAGAIAQTMKLYGAFSSTASNGILLCTLTLTGTTATSDACPVITANFSYYYVVTTASSGLTTAVMYAMY